MQTVEQSAKGYAEKFRYVVVDKRIAAAKKELKVTTIKSIKANYLI